MVLHTLKSGLTRCYKPIARAYVIKHKRDTYD